MDVLQPSGGQESARDFVGRLGLRAGGGDRPRVVADMIAAADGRTTINGRSVGLGNPEDRALLRELRAGCDAVLAGSRTLVTERYANLLDADQREARTAAGLSPHPVLVTVDRAGRLGPTDVPVFSEAGVPVRIYTEGDPQDFTDATAEAQAVSLGEPFDFTTMLTDLRDRDGVDAVSCEGGPGLLRELIAQGCLDDLLLTVSPMLIGGPGTSLLAGDVFDMPVRLELVDVLRSDQHLFLHYVPA